MSKQNLTRHALKGMQWATLGRLLKSFVSLGTITFLSYYLTPEEFGGAGIIAVVAMLAQLLVDAGLRTALVQRKENTRIQQDTVFWSSLVLAALLGVGLYHLSEPIALWFEAPELAPFICWMALVLPLSALQSVPMTILERQFKFQRIAMSDLLASFLGAMVAIVLALLGWTIGALVAQQICLAVVSTTIICLSGRWMPRLRFSGAEFRSLLGYGGYVMLTNVLGFLNGNLDRLIIAGVISTNALGFYNMGKTVVESPSKTIVTMARKTLFPILSSVQDDLVRMQRAYLRVQFSLSAVMMPICFGIAAIAQPIVDVLFAPEWAGVGPILQLIGIHMAFPHLQQVNQVTLAALGLAKVQFWWSLLSGATVLAVIWMAAPFGIEAVIWARIAVMLAMIPTLSSYTMRRLEQPLHRLGAVLLAPLISAAGMYGLVHFVAVQVQISAVATLMLCIPLGGVVYVVLLFVLAPTQSKDLLRAFSRRGG